MIRDALIHASFSEREYRSTREARVSFRECFLNLAGQDRLEQQWSFGRNQKHSLEENLQKQHSLFRQKIKYFLPALFPSSSRVLQ